MTSAPIDESITTMNPTSARDVEQAVAAVTSTLRPMTDADWTIPAGDLQWSCWQTAAHVAHDLLAYAGQVTASPREAYLPLDLVVRADAPPAQLLQIVQTSASLLVLSLDSASLARRAWHFGLTDPSGFATLGVNELLVHTWDIAQGLGLHFDPPAELAQKVVDRLWTSAPPGPAGQVLLWCTGRVALPGLPRQSDWVTPSPAPTPDQSRHW
ncbi:MAG: maleylpyruvate isomerase family mycothiol-dependent enzyme [Quadrisphaera sp.]